MRILGLVVSILVIAAFAPATAAFCATSGFIKIADHSVYYEVSGTGEPVLLIHGGYLDSTMWDSQVKYLNKKGFKTIRYDEIGHGRTVSGKESVKGHEVIEKLIEANNIDKVSIVGLSWGAVLAIEFALAAPEKVDKLVILSPGLSGWQYFQDPVAQATYEKRKIALEKEDKNDFVELFQQNWIYGPGQKRSRVKKPVRDKTGQMIKGNTELHWKESWSELMSPAAKDRLGEIKNKTLIVTGSLDVKDIHLIAAKYDAELQNSEHKIIEDVGHTFTLEKPRKINRLIRKFLEK